MQLTGEVKDDAYADLPRQQQAEYAPSTDTFLRSDASTGRHYYDLNAATKAYSGPWLFGKQHVEVLVGNLKAQWLQWCPVPADIRDGVLMRGNVIYQNPDGSYRISGDLFEGVIRTEHGLTSERFLIGRTQHTFYGPQLPNGRMQVIANLRIPLTERLSYNPMIPRSRSEQPAVASYSSYPSDENAPEHQWSQVVTQQTPDYQTPASYPQQAAPMSSSWL
ncbi:MAG TPA: hypothetical protein V6D17_09605, partial [Candidatus Obscuribacterales bacterium]